MNDFNLPEELRLFIACQLPPEWTEALRAVERELRGQLPRLRWVRPEGIHLTLKFLGEVGRHLLPDLRAGLAAACAPVPPFELHLGGLGRFGGRGNVRVLWAGVEGDLDTLLSLHKLVDAAMHEQGFARETRPFSPHLTLARVPEDAPGDLAQQVHVALQRTRVPRVEPFRVREVSLVRSQLGPGGAAYTPLFSAALATEA